MILSKALEEYWDASFVAQLPPNGYRDVPQAIITWAVAAEGLKVAYETAPRYQRMWYCWKVARISVRDLPVLTQMLAKIVDHG